MGKRVGVVLSGCGVFDGSEVQESVAALIALDRRGAQIICMAPDIQQAQVIDHLTKKPVKEKRNVRTESARIARGKVRDLADVRADELDAIVFPGGFGAAKNLSTFAADGAECTVNPDVQRLLKDMHAARKPIGLACIAPALAARVLGGLKREPHLTIGCDAGTARALEAMGARHHTVGPAEVHVDARNRLVTTPCYMNDVGPWVVFEGMEKLCEEVLRMTGDQASLIRGQMAILPD